MTLSTRMSLEVQHVVAIAMLLLMVGLPLSAGVLMVMRMQWCSQVGCCRWWGTALVDAVDGYSCILFVF